MDYVSAVAERGGESKAACTCRAYERLLNIAKNAGSPVREKLLDCLSTLGTRFDAYVAAMMETNRGSDVAPLIETFLPLWDHNMGYGRLGMAAFQIGDERLAETLFEKLREMEEWFRCDEMNALAEIWQRKGRTEEARALLIAALEALLAKSRRTTGSDRRLYEEWFQSRRAAYLAMFPELGGAELERAGIPASTIGGSN